MSHVLLSSLLDVRCLKSPLDAADKWQAIDELVGLLVEAGRVRDRDAVRRVVRDRETAKSTGIGEGVAIPHGKTAAVEGVVAAIGVTSAPMDFDAIDGRPVDIIVLLISQVDKSGPHIQALAGIARLMRDPALRDALRCCTDPADMLRTIEHAEQQEH